jgi:hypothetical protein
MPRYCSLAVGSVSVPAGIRVRYQGYETAAWWEERELRAGEYALMLDARNNLTARVPGTVTDAYFPSLWGGVPIAGTDPRRGVGGATEHWLHVSVDAGGNLVCHQAKAVSARLSPPFHIGSKVSGGYTLHAVMDGDGNDVHMDLILMESLPFNLSDAGLAAASAAIARWRDTVVARD